MAESESRRAEGEIPPNQFLAPEYVLADMARHGSHRINTMSAAQILILGVIGGAFITAGALFSILLGAGVSSPGPQRPLEGLGFSAGFFFVILSGAVLFTEANVVMPATLLECDAASPSSSFPFPRSPVIPNDLCPPTSSSNVPATGDRASDPDHGTL